MFISEQYNAIYNLNGEHLNAMLDVAGAYYWVAGPFGASVYRDVELMILGL